MGLLDDAIREHLELKRRRGADPGEVAQQERAALDPAFAEQEPEHAAEADAELVSEESVADELEAHEQPILDPDLIAGEETAEIDMREVLEGDVHEGHQGDVLGSEALDPEVPHSEEDLIDWEAPEHPGEDTVPEQIPGQERLSFE
jgi:hypothetical protein